MVHATHIIFCATHSVHLLVSDEWFELNNIYIDKINMLVGYQDSSIESVRLTLTSGIDDLDKSNYHLTEIGFDEDADISLKFVNIHGHIIDFSGIDPFYQENQRYNRWDCVIIDDDDITTDDVNQFKESISMFINNFLDRIINRHKKGSR